MFGMTRKTFHVALASTPAAAATLRPEVFFERSFLHSSKPGRDCAPNCAISLPGCAGRRKLLFV
jgi:hypothetical protein